VAKPIGRLAPSPLPKEHSNHVKSRTSIFGTAVVGLIGAIIGSFSMMLYASTHFAGVAGPGNTPPAVQAAPLVAGGTTVTSSEGFREPVRQYLERLKLAPA